jgi:hypothetical protein
MEGGEERQGGGFRVSESASEHRLLDFHAILMPISARKQLIDLPYEVATRAVHFPSDLRDALQSDNYFSPAKGRIIVIIAHSAPWSPPDRCPCF